MMIELLVPMTLFYALLGLLIGSFLNVCIYRIPRGESVAAGRSHCPHCNHVLGALDLVPIVSYFALGKKCRYCHTPIASRYAIVEAVVAVIFALSGFALTALGLLIGWGSGLLLLVPFIDVTILSILFTVLMIRYTPSTRAIQLFVAIDLIHIWIIWLLFT
ncbi:MAG: prepilin peptidase [Eubacteriales bacterium]|nr:prepilin peptidase [Eubacteriales bacterium]